jgi:prepilin-type processing-associated H-X9-DG protein/prepilin-type N-terminal cleavage/methylation domain-containing protein
MRKSNRDAFTLTELLAVVAVIGILAALLVSSVILGKRKAQQIQCSSNLHQLGLALRACVVDDHAYPTCPFWMDKLQHEGMGISASIGYPEQKGVWKCPSTQFSHCYGYNAYGVLNGEHPPEYWNAQALGLLGHGQSIPRAPVRESEVVNPSDMMAIGDSFDDSTELMRYSLEYYRCSPKDLPKFTDRLTRHRGKANVVFCDGHVESPTLKFLFDDTSDAALVRWNRDHFPHRDRL